MYPLDDLTPEEMEPDNRAIATMLSQVYSHTPEASEAEQAYTIMQARRRLFMGEQVLSQDSNATLPGQWNVSKHDPVVVFPQRKSPWSTRLSLLASVAVMLVLLGSAVLIPQVLRRQYHQVQTGTTASTATTATHEDESTKAHRLVQQFHQEAEAWGKAHLYHDSFDGKDYMLDSGYLTQGIGSALDLLLAQARSNADFAQVIHAANDALFNLHQFEAAASDKTPFTMVHNSDLQILKHYGLQEQTVIVVSLAEQALRVYHNGHLMHSFLVTTGREEKPSLPGAGSILYKQSPAILKSTSPKSSPDWFPDTHVNYVMSYHVGGYLMIDSWWRATHGPGTQFPHHDASGNESFAGNGGRGSIALSEADAKWLYGFSGVGMAVVVY